MKNQIRILAFGIARDILQASSLDLDLNEIKTVGELKKYLKSEYEGFSKIIHFDIAVNQEYQNDNWSLNREDEIAIIPPVSGG